MIQFDQQKQHLLVQDDAFDGYCHSFYLCVAIGGDVQCQIYKQHKVGVYLGILEVVLAKSFYLQELK